MGKWGGKRDGAGRPKGSAPGNGYRVRRRSLYCSDEEWQMVVAAADERGLSVSEWIRRAVWQTDMTTGISIGLTELPW
jgi:hypothetical protein